MKQSTEVVLEEEVSGSWVGCVGAMVVKSYMAMFGERLIMDGVSLRRVVGSLGFCSQSYMESMDYLS